MPWLHAFLLQRFSREDLKYIYTYRDVVVSYSSRALKFLHVTPSKITLAKDNLRHQFLG